MSHRVLMIAWCYYPSNTSGAHRPAKFAKYLPEFGWTPVVLCAHWTPENLPDCYDAALAARPDVCRVVRVPQPPRSRGKPLRGAGWLLRWLLPYRMPLGGMRRMLAACRSLLKEERFDAIWSTYGPGLNHTVAAKIARETGLPWVADFRDLPDQSENTWLTRLCVRREVATCRGARLMTTVAPDLSRRLHQRYEVPVHVILNGFDPQDFAPPAPVRAEKFDILYTGILYAYRDPRPLFQGLDRLVERGLVDAEDVRLRFYGSSEERVRSLAQGSRFADRIEVFDRVPYPEMVRLQQQAAVLLSLMGSDAPGVPAKTYDYLAAGRPILNVPGGGLVDGILEETNAGASATTPEHVAEVLLAWYREWKATGTVAWHGRPDKIKRYSRREQTGELARLLERLVA